MLLVDLILLLPIGWLSDRLVARVVLTPALLLIMARLPICRRRRASGGCLSSLSACTPALQPGVCLQRPWHYAPQRTSLARTMGIYRLLVDGAVVIAPLARWHTHRAVWLWPAGVVLLPASSH